jgi:hypothetical protein
MNKPEREGFVEDRPVGLEQLDPPEPPDPPKPRKAALEKPTPAEPPVPPVVQEPLPDEWPIVIKLRKPTREGGKNTPEITELRLREPRARDIIDAGGNPCRFEVTSVAGAGNVWVYNWIIDDNKMMRLMANLAGVLETAIFQLDTRDYNNAAQRLRRFFIAERDSVW